MRRAIRVTHSPDSDDAFMFYALATGRIDTGDIHYVHELQDIESLNRRALRGELEVSALSIHAYAHVADRYLLLAHGASMGDGYGPRLVSRTALQPSELRGRAIAVPGLLTTAYLALRLLLPDFEPVSVPFDQIEDDVAEGRFDAGLLIHEGQLTHRERGLELVADLGQWWKDSTGLPLPLGGNVVRRDLGGDIIASVSRHLYDSIAYSLANPDEALAYARRYSRGLGVEETRTFVSMYVNNYTLDYGPVGRQAVRELLERAARAGIVPHVPAVEFFGH
jgi:1,4-dihydroxy-6-naphthoate synthase